MEAKMLYCTDGIIHNDQIRNENIRDRYGVALIVETLRETPLMVWTCNSHWAEYRNQLETTKNRLEHR